MDNMDKDEKYTKRYSVLLLIMVVIFIVIISRMIYLQVFRYEDYKTRANVASREVITEKAPRGKIYDSTGNTLATNMEAYNVTFSQNEKNTDSFFSIMDKTFKILDDYNEKQKDDLKLKYSKDKGFYFLFNTDDNTVKKAMEVTFKNDRGIADFIKGKTYKNISDEDYNEEKQQKVKEESLKITPEQTFNFMLWKYSMYSILNLSKDEKKALNNKINAANVQDAFKIIGDLAKRIESKCSIEKLRRYVIVKDAIQMQYFTSTSPINLAENISKNTAFIFYQKMSDMPGIDVSLEPVRYYPYHNLASSVLGYISSIDSSKKDRYEEKGYSISSDKIGVTGIEAAFETYLRGKNGGKIVKVDSKGRATDELSQLASTPGYNVHLTINRDLQAVAERALKENMQRMQVDPLLAGNAKNATRAAVVVQEVNTGRILALANAPDYDPNTFSVPGLLTDEKMKEYFAPDYEAFAKAYILRNGLNKTVDDLFPKQKDGTRLDKYEIYPKPFYNYATMGTLPPGSTFKALTSLAGLESGVITPDTKILDKGKFDDYPEISGKNKSYAPECEVYTESNGLRTHGLIDVRDALMVSCNYFYYETAYRLWKNAGEGTKNLDVLAKYAWKVGLGYDVTSNEKPGTGIEIQEKFGNVYSLENFKDTICLYGKLELVDAMRQGHYGSYKFIPLEIGNNDTDKEDLKNAKNKLKDMIIARIHDEGTDKNVLGYDAFVKSLKQPLMDIINLSPAYKQSVEKAGSTVSRQVDIISIALGQFAVFDKAKAATAPAELINSSIGQGADEFTPLQLAGYIATVMNGGTRYKAHLVDKITDVNGNVINEFKPEIISKMNINKANLDAIKAGMVKVNQQGEGETGGGTSAQWWVGFPISTGGKTGTASYTSNSNDQKAVGRGPYGVYVSFAPVDNPKIAVCVVTYDGYQGNQSAPVARAIYENYFKDDLKKMNYTPTYPYAFDPQLKDMKDTTDTKQK